MRRFTKTNGARQWLAVLALMLAVVACGNGDDAGGSTTTAASEATTTTEATPASEAPEPVSVLITHTVPVPILAIAEFAIQEGLFPSYIEAESQLVGDSQAVPLMAAGTSEFMVAGAPRPQETFAAGVPVGTLAEWANPPDNQLIVAEGIESLDDLAGQQIGITGPGSFADIFVRFVLDTAGLTADEDYDIVPLGDQAALIAAFGAGQIAAFPTAPPLTQQVLAEVEGSSIIYDAQDTGILWPAPQLTGYMPWVEENPEATVDFLRGLNEAWELFRSDRAKALEWSASLSPDADPAVIEAGYDALLEAALPSFRPVSVETEEFVFQTLIDLGNEDVSVDMAAQLTQPQYMEEALNR